MKKNAVNREVEAVLNEANDRLDKIAATFRKQALLPLCRKYNLEFKAGNGTMAFFAAEGDWIEGSDDRRFSSIGTMEDAHDAGMADLAKAFQVLDIEGIGINDCIGYRVADIDKADWEGG